VKKHSIVKKAVNTEVREKYTHRLGTLGFFIFD
jgi:hypothetical protein